MEEQNLLHVTLSGYILGSSFCCQILQKGGARARVFLFAKTCVLAKLIFQITVKKMIFKFLPLNQRLYHLNCNNITAKQMQQ